MEERQIIKSKIKKYRSSYSIRFVQCCLIAFYILGAILGFVVGYQWCFYKYQPLKLAQENKELKVKVKALNRAWVSEFSERKGLIEEKDGKSDLR